MLESMKGLVVEQEAHDGHGHTVIGLAGSTPGTAVQNPKISTNNQVREFVRLHQSDQAPPSSSPIIVAV